MIRGAANHLVETAEVDAAGDGPEACGPWFGAVQLRFNFPLSGGDGGGCGVPGHGPGHDGPEAAITECSGEGAGGGHGGYDVGGGDSQHVVTIGTKSIVGFMRFLDVLIWEN